MSKNMKTVLTIAGSDSSGGAGIQADLKTMMAHKVYGMSVITALTAQNTTGVAGIMEVTPEFVAQQLDCVFKDIRPDAVKIGMVSNAAIIKVIAEKLVEYKAENIVVDPVMVATSGSSLMQDDASQALRTLLLPLADVITPNVPEGEVLSGVKNRDEGGYAGCSGPYRFSSRNQCAPERRPSQGQRRRSALYGRKSQLVRVGTDRKPEYARHRLHAFLSHRSESGFRSRNGREHPPSQSLHHRRAPRRTGSGQGQRPAQSCLPHQLKKKTGASALVFFFRL